MGTAAVGATALILHRFVIRPWHLHWGATDEEVWRSMPGDDRIQKPDVTFTRAITIKAPVKAVWPWLVQMIFTLILDPIDDRRSRLIVRFRGRFNGRLERLWGRLLFDFGDFIMMRKMLLGIKERAESTAPPSTTFV